jgi:hypothetical protein
MNARKLADEGKPFIMEDKKIDISVAVFQIIQKMEQIIG